MVVLSSRNDEFVKVMTHRTRRKILECLRETDLSFIELLDRVGPINHGRFGYHLRMLKGFVELDPSTRRYRLTNRGRRLTGSIRDFSLVASVNEEYARYVENLRFGDHAFSIYHSEDFRRKISMPYIRAGLMKGEAVVYIVAENKLNSEMRELQKHGIDLEQMPRGAFTIMSAYEWYIERGKAEACLLYTSPSPRDRQKSRMPSSA